MSERLLNLSDIAVKRQLMAHIGTLQGLYDVVLKPRKRSRSLDQNAYYFAAVVQPFTEWLQETYGDPQITKDQAHELLKRTVLGMKEKWIDTTKLEVTRDSRSLDTKEFSDYIEGCAKFLSEFCGIVIVPSDLYFQGAVLPNKPE